MGAPPRLSLNDLMTMSAQARNRNAGPFTSATPPQRPAFTPGVGMTMPSYAAGLGMTMPSYAGQMGNFGAAPSPGFNPLAVAAGFNPMQPGDYNQFNQALMQFRTPANPQMPGMVGFGMAHPGMMQQLGGFLTASPGGQQTPTPNVAQQTPMNYGNLPGAPSYNPETGIGYNY